MKIKSLAIYAMQPAGLGRLSVVLRRSSLALALSVIGTQTVGTAQAAYNKAGTPVGDLSIYTSANPGGANVMLMLDVSGSMGVFKYPYGQPGNYYVSTDSIKDDFDFSCVSTGNNKVNFTNGSTYDVWEKNHGLGQFNNSITISGELISYKLEGCTDGQWKVDLPSGAIQDKRYLYYYNGYWRWSDYKYTFVPDAFGQYRLSNSNGFMYRTSSNIGPRYRIYDDASAEWKLNNSSNWTWDAGKDRWVATSNGVTLEDNRLDRISRLKHALIQSLGTFTQADVDLLPPGSKVGYGIAPDGREVKAGDYRIASKNLVGLGQFSGDMKYSDGTKERTSSQGQILVAAKELTEEHRKVLIKTIATFTASGGTPSANAYAETGAYMLGTSTNGNYTGTSYGYSYDLDGFSLSVSDFLTDASDIKNSSTYVEPGTDKQYQCYGKGIYFLTDGVPNTAFSDTSEMMKRTLNGTGKTMGSTPLPITGTNAASESGWQYIGQYAQALRTDSRYTDIKTATVGFGKVFQDLAKANRISITNSKGNKEDIIDCDATTSTDGNSISIGQDAINLCNWGRKENYTGSSVLLTDKKWGGGGFTVARSSKDIENSLLEFIQDGSAEVDSIPGGTITVPDDPYRGGRVTPFAYLPMLQPQLDGNPSIWQGNVKKYATKDGTLYGLSDKRLYKPASQADGGELNNATDDFWWKPSQTPPLDNSEIHSGGFYANLLAPEVSKVGSTRNVYVESYTDGGDNLIQISVDIDGKTKNFPKISDTVYGTNKAERLRSKRKMLNFMGYTIQPDGNVDKDGNDLDTTFIANLDMRQFLPSSPIRQLGGVIHSKPALVSYSADVDDFGNVKTEEQDREDYLLFGSMDGALHLVDVDTGQEKWALILQAMFQQQSDALVQGSKGSLKFGIDAPWLVTSSYDYQDDAAGNQKVTLDSKANIPLAAYGGFRMGGRGLYAIDLENVNKPQVMFSLTPSISDSSKVVLHKDGTEEDVKDYNHMGQIWSQPTMGRLYDGATKAEKDVIIFGGGYDDAYEDPTFVPTSATKARGRSVYVVDAKEGKKEWAWNGKTEDGEEYFHSIVGGITTLDRNNDGAFDYLYFADLGGNVFRADFTNEKQKSFSNVRVTRIFAASDGLPDDSKHLAYRFYNRPVVSFYKTLGGKLFALINIASGNRSSPLSKLRTNNDYANKVYGIIDRELTTGDLLASGNSGPATTSDIVETDLTKLGGDILEGQTAVDDSNKYIPKLCSPMLDTNGNAQTNASGGFIYSEVCKKKIALISDMLTNGTQGWYYPLTRFDGFEGIKNIKAIGDYTVIGGYLYMTAYDSNMKFKEVDQCSADVKGASENQLYCLPYGVCMNDSSATGTGGFSPAVKGIQELTIGAVDEDNTNIKTLVGIRTLKERTEYAVAFGEPATGQSKKENLITEACEKGNCVEDYKDSDTEGGDGSMADMLFTERYMMTPRQWYEVSE